MTKRELALVCNSCAALNLCSGGEMCLLAYDQGSVAACATFVRLECSWELCALPAKNVGEQNHVAESLQAGKTMVVLYKARGWY